MAKKKELKPEKEMPVEKEPVIKEEPIEVEQKSVYRRKRGGGKGFLGPFILLSIGIIFLFNNFGVLPWSVWDTIWKFWPVLLIISALEMIFGFSSWTRWLMIFFVPAIIIFILVTIFTFPFGRVNFSAGRGAKISIGDEELSFSAPEKMEKTIVLSRDDYPEIEKREIAVESGVAKLNLSAKEEAALVEVKTEYFDGFGSPMVETDFQNGLLKVNLKNEFTSKRIFFNSFREISQEVAFGHFDLPSSFDLDVGAGKLEADFGQALVGRLGLNVGAGAADLVFTGKSIPSSGVSLEVGVGSAKLILPKEVGLKINYNIGIGNLKIAGENGFRGEGIYLSEGFDSKEVKLEIGAKVGVGSLTIDFE